MNRSRIGPAIAAGWGIDRLVGEPPVAIHPVAGFGTCMSALERRLYAPSRAAGALHAGIGVGAAVALGWATQRVMGRWAATCCATAVSVAGHMLAGESEAVLSLVEGSDLTGARHRLRGLVGRDTEALDESSIVRAVVESMAENTVDAVIAPLCWAAVAGAPGVLAHRAVNTLDAMIGHRNERYDRFGWAAARADDVMNYVPARVAATAVAVLVPSRARSIWRTVRRDAPAHPSPNGGVIEAATAAALDVRLGGANAYGGAVEDRGMLGDGGDPTVADGRRAIRLLTKTGALVAFTVALVR